MQHLPKVLETKAKIRFQDCDPFNHLNNGSYTNYFMNHREDALIENYDLDIYKIAKKEGKSWVSSSNQIAYLKPAFLGDVLTGKGKVDHKGNRIIHASGEIYNQNNELIAKAMGTLNAYPFEKSDMTDYLEETN